MSRINYESVSSRAQLITQIPGELCAIKSRGFNLIFFAAVKIYMEMLMSTRFSGEMLNFISWKMSVVLFICYIKMNTFLFFILNIF